MILTEKGDEDLKELLKKRIRCNLNQLNNEDLATDDKYFLKVTNMIIRDYLILMATKEVGVRNGTTAR